MLELARGAPRDRDAEHRAARRPATPRARRRARTSCPSRPCRPPRSHRRRPRQSRSTIRRCSADERRPRRDRSPHAPLARATPAPRAVGRADLADEPLLEREQLRGRVDELVALDRQQPPVAAPVRLAAPRARAAARPRAVRRGTGPSRPRSPRASTSAPAGTRSHNAWKTSRRENVDAPPGQPGRRRRARRTLAATLRRRAPAC